MVNRMSELELELLQERLKVEREKAEIEAVKRATDKVRAEIEAIEEATKNARRSQMGASAVALITALGALGASWCNNTKSETAYNSTRTAVSALNQNQREAHEAVAEIRDYAVTLSSASAVVPVVLPVEPASPRTTGRKPPPAASSSAVVVKVAPPAPPPPESPPPADVAMPSY